MRVPAHPFFIALQFLTRLPIRLAAIPDDRARGRSLLWYPAVGALLGALLAGLAWLLQPLPPALQAALLLAVWALATGLLHLDGLADCADAWLGGHGVDDDGRARTLAIMKDPHCGTAAIVILVLVLLLKFAALQALLQRPCAAITPLFAPLLARTAVLPLFVSTAYVRSGGLGSVLAAQLDRRAAVAVTLAVTLALAAFAGPAIAAVAVTLLVVRALALRRLGGFTGDVAGALIELAELAAQLALL
ncbi:adenosylcobinamide-GDP ribazoletransferase [Solimonas soli]|uniref:adenosylcobinamide-GDP ribazoletransferase n=1 Tax=Solimonas soli TaxID=413479 RepID=UPI00047FC329|nr:adenosylcobinamide-GDP ribazoletransferase [Solimonas soli]